MVLVPVLSQWFKYSSFQIGHIFWIRSMEWRQPLQLWTSASWLQAILNNESVVLESSAKLKPVQQPMQPWFGRRFKNYWLWWAADNLVHFFTPVYVKLPFHNHIAIGARRRQRRQTWELAHWGNGRREMCVMERQPYATLHPYLHGPRYQSLNWKLPYSNYSSSPTSQLGGL